MVSSDCLISNDETPWTFLSAYLENGQNERDDTQQTNPFTDRPTTSSEKKDIQIVIDSNIANEPEPDIDKIIEKNDEITMKQQMVQRAQIEQQQKEQQAKEEKLKKEHEEKVKNAVLQLQSNDHFDEEWFVWIESKKIGPLSRWELVKKAKNGELNEETPTYLNGQYRYLRDCGELRGLLPFEIELNATAHTSEGDIVLTQTAMENQQSIGPLSLSEIFYKFSEGIIGRNSQIKTEKEICWKTMEFLQNKFSKEWKKWKDGKCEEEVKTTEVDNVSVSDKELNAADIESFDPSFRALIDLDKKFENGQMNGTVKDNEQRKKKKKRKNQRKRKREKAACSILVSGLPDDITEDEISIFFKKAGVIQTDIYQRGKKKILLNDNGSALITFHQPYSVKLALDILDETEIRNGYPVHIKAAADPKPIRKKQKMDPHKEAMLKKLYGVKSELNWNEDAGHEGLRWVVLENMFSLDEVNDAFIAELEKEIVVECSKIGKIDKIQIIGSNPSGVIKIKFKKAKDSAQCIEKMNDRFFDGKVIKCYYWDGFTDYSVEETAEQQEMRLRQFQEDMKKKTTNS